MPSRRDCHADDCRYLTNDSDFVNTVTKTNFNLVQSCLPATFLLPFPYFDRLPALPSSWLGTQSRASEPEVLVLSFPAKLRSSDAASQVAATDLGGHGGLSLQTHGEGGRMSNRNLGRWIVVTSLVGFLGISGALPANAAQPAGPLAFWNWLNSLWNAPLEGAVRVIPTPVRRTGTSKPAPLR
jgi:hypothetical protein